MFKKQWILLVLGGLIWFQFITANPKPATAPKGGEVQIYKTIGELELPLYIYKPESHSKTDQAPAIVFFFGGGWTSGTPSQFEEHCKGLAKRGMVAITVEYRVASRHKAKIEDCIEDAKSAMRWVRGHASELGIDPNRIASGGGSAGGHLGASVSLIDDFNASSDDQSISAKPNAMVLFNPAMVLAPHESLPAEANEMLKAMGQSRANKTHGPREKVSPLQYVTNEQPPCIMFFGTEDRLLSGAEIFCEESEKAGNECKIVTYEGQGHGFFNYRNKKYYELTFNEMDSFLVKLGWLN